MKHICPDCGGPLVLFYSTHKKICGACKTEFDWKLTAGQKSIVVEGLTAESIEKQTLQKCNQRDSKLLALAIHTDATRFKQEPRHA